MMADEIGSFIICPYCQYLHPDPCDYPEGIDNQAEMECWDCGKEFTVIGTLTWTFETWKKKEGE